MPHIPKPFSRPAIDLTPGGAKKQWVTTKPEFIRPGDIVRGEGLVQAIELKWETGYAAQNDKRIVCSMASGKTLTLKQGEPVVAFTAAEGEPLG